MKLYGKVTQAAAHSVKTGNHSFVKVESIRMQILVSLAGYIQIVVKIWRGCE